MKLSDSLPLADQMEAYRKVLISTTIEAAIQSEIDEMDSGQVVYLGETQESLDEMRAGFTRLFDGNLDLLKEKQESILRGEPIVDPNVLSELLSQLKNQYQQLGPDKANTVCLMYDEMPNLYIDLWMLQDIDPKLEHKVYLPGKELTKYGDIGPLNLDEFGFYDYSLEENFENLDFFSGYFGDLLALRDINILQQVCKIVAAELLPTTPAIIVGKYNESLCRFR